MPGVFPFLLLISEYLVVIILDAVSMLLCVCKWLHSAARVEGGGELLSPSVSHMGETTTGNSLLQQLQGEMMKE